MKNNKASLQLSINTVVLLVMALALLGVVLAATFGLFEASEEKLMRSMLVVDASAKATSLDIIAGADAFTVPRRKDKIIAISFYNNGNVDCAQSANAIFICPEGIRSHSGFANIDVAVPIGQERTLPILINVPGTIPQKDYVCRLRVECGSHTVEEQHTILRVK